jgi:hypothetical protein
LCEHCEHVWIAVSCYVKLFPNLAAALKGVFNRVLKKFTQSERVSTGKARFRVLEKNARHVTGGSYSQGGGSEGSWIVEAKSQRDPFEEGRR